MRLQKILSNDKILAVLLVIIATIASIIDYSLSEPISVTNNYTNYNNYLIFKQSFFNLLSSKDLYIHYPLFHFDLFKYSSTFALLFGVFAYLRLSLFKIMLRSRASFGIRIIQIHILLILFAARKKEEEVAARRRRRRRSPPENSRRFPTLRWL